jgi:hypothetical protein
LRPTTSRRANSSVPSDITFPRSPTWERSLSDGAASLKDGVHCALTSLRYGVTQALAATLRAAGSDGFIYRSAQQYGADCYCIVGAALLSTLHLVARVALTNPAGGLHRVVVDALRGAQVPLVP